MKSLMKIVVTLMLASECMAGPAEIVAEMDRLKVKNPAIAKDPAAEVVFAAMASGQFSTDGKDPERLGSRRLGMGGRVTGGIASDGFYVGNGPGARDLKTQRFLEMNHLVPFGTSQKERIEASRNQIRFVAKTLGLNIATTEAQWVDEDGKAEIQALRRQLDSIQVQQQDMANEIQRLRVR